MLFTPEAHESLADAPWSADRARTAIASIVADAESAFDDGWPMHPLDVGQDDDPAARFRTVYLGGAGVVAVLHRLARRGFVELRRDYVPYLKESLDAPPDFPADDAERSLWMGETGIRLVLQRLAPSQGNLERLAELIAGNERDERCELMWGSPGTILAGRELGLDVTASIEWLQEQRDADGLWTQHLYGYSGRCLGPAHGFAGCVLALGDVADVSETLQPFAVEEDGLVNWLPYAGMPGDRCDARRHARRGTCSRGSRVDLARRAAAKGCKPLPRHGRERIRVPGPARADGRRAVAHARARVRDARGRSGGAQPVGVRTRSPYALDRRPRHGSLPRRLRRR